MRDPSRAASTDFPGRGRAPEQIVERWASHRQSAQVIEILLIETKRPVLAQIDQLAVDRIDDTWAGRTGARPMTLYSPELTLKPT